MSRRIAARWLELLRCPCCMSALVAKETALACRSCGSEHPIILGVPRFVPSDGYAESFGRQWKAHSRTQLDSVSGLSITRDRFFAASRWPARLEGQKILEAGSGAGRFTEVLCATGADILSMDMSLAVEANLDNNGANENLLIVQADIASAPLAEAIFDRAVCFGVLQHTRDPRAAFMNLVRCLKPGGGIACDIYRKSIAALLQWKYLLRPITRRAPAPLLYQVLQAAVGALIPPTKLLRRWGGHYGARLSPIVEYSHLGLDESANRDWALLDTFDMYAPRYDLPQSLSSVRAWLTESGLVDAYAEDGPNGIVFGGRKPR